jgi:hypothetical protein
MDISKYTAWFHDGGLIDIEHHDNKISLSMISAEICDDDFPKNISLSKDFRLKGKLHLSEISSIEVDNEPLKGTLTKFYDSGNIYDLSIKDHIITLIASWTNYPPKKREQTDLFTYKITANQIYWEPVENLTDPYG